MADRQSGAGGGAGEGLLVLGVDTCGAEGSVALARMVGGEARMLGQVRLAGRTYSATLVSAVGELLEAERVKLADVGAVVVVNGPGSFTGVRVGVSAVKGLAEPGQIPVVAVSRLAVLAAKAGVGAAALDAHRHEVFLRVGLDGEVREMLAGVDEISRVLEGLIEGRSPVPKGEGPGAPRVVPRGVDEISQVSEARPFDKLRAGSGAPSVVAVSQVSDARSLPHEPRPVCEDPGPVAPSVVATSEEEALRGAAVCEEAAEGVLRSAWPGVGLVRVEPPTAGDAIRVCLPAILAGEFADLAALDGHYLRRSDAEIFGDAAQRA